MPPAMGFRQIHLDFHTSPLIPGIASQFDADRFADMVQAANVDSVTCFAKCHHGHLYYNTDRPERHPQLPKGKDLLRMQVDALHARGIRAPIYISIQCDEYAANTHPEWVVRNPDGGLHDGGPFFPMWQILDMSSPFREFLREQTQEICEQFSPMDGVFFDMCWNQPSVSSFAKRGMLERGFDPEKEADRNAYADWLSQDYMKELSALVRKYNGKNASVYFNSRPLNLLTKDLRWMTHVEIEALATGGWGYMYFPLNVRYVRSFGAPYMGMTARFHKSWADFGGLKPEAALRFEISQMIAHGAKCSIGDQLHPRGTLEQPAWEMIGRVYGYAKDCQPWCENATSAADVAVLRSEGGLGGNNTAAGGTNEGLARMFMQLKTQFDIIEADMSFTKYRLLVLPDQIVVDQKLARKLDAYVAAGGSVLVTGQSALGGELKPTWKGLPISGPAALSPYKTTYFKPGKQLLSAVQSPSAMLPDMNHVLYERGLRVKPAAGAEVLAAVVEPYFDRNWQHFSSHFQTASDKLTKYPAALVKGRVGYIPYQIFSMYANHGSIACRQLIAAMMHRLVGLQMVEALLPSGAEVSVMKKGKATVLHVLYWSAERRTPNLDIIEDTVPLVEVPISIALPRRPGKLYLAPQREELEFDYANGRASFVIPRIDGHQMMVFE